MKTIFYKAAGTVLMGLSLLSMGSGCATMYGQEEAAQQEQDRLIQEERMQKLNGRIENLELQVERLQMDMDALRASQGRSSQTQALQSSLDDVNRRISALESSRAKDRQEIVDSLSRKIAEIYKTSAPSRPQATPKKKTSSTGYEHVVKAGETLSAIASAYGVKPSVIMDANNIKDANSLKVGQKLFIPD
jgi:LysM repeat protein